MGIPASPESVSENPAEEPAQPESAPTPSKKQRFRRSRRILRLRSVRLVLALLTLCFAWLRWSIGSALAALGDDSVLARVAEWARDPIAVWGRDASLTPNLTGVRQSLKLIVDHGRVPDSVDNDVESGWGLTIAGKYFVWRSGVGVTAEGRLLFAYGPALSVRTLADLLASAGAVRAMQLDINPAWMSFMYDRPQPDPANPTAVRLLPAQKRPADRYYEDTGRDFTAVYAR